MKKYLLLFAVCYAAHTNAQITIDAGTNQQLNQLRPCTGELNAVAAVSLGQQRRTTTVFNHNGGTFDSPALLSTTINVKNSSCVVVHFSANTYIADNSVVYQVRIDGVPMEGHLTSVLPAVGNSSQPIVLEAHLDSNDVKTYRMSSYSFFSRVSPGTHKIEVMVAGCCSANTSGSPIVVADNATLIVQYNKN